MRIKALANSLLADPKELAEHIMLVDLARNDLGRISDFGTLQVDELKGIRTLQSCHASHITGIWKVSKGVFSQLTYLGRLSLQGLFPERPKF
ncbi:MAG: hypothetical protein Ct9H90mP11_08370 [Acidimicrobiales bacterium]|nr:MAG: hypothetical protein Ct9H90mP11_08370 [Acidimicrobiales bacterium]